MRSSDSTALLLKFVHATQRPFGETTGQQAGSSETRMESETPGTEKNNRDLSFFSLKNRHVRASGRSRVPDHATLCGSMAVSAPTRTSILRRVASTHRRRDRGLGDSSWGSLTFIGLPCEGVGSKPKRRKRDATAFLVSRFVASR